MILLSVWGATLQADSGRPEPAVPVFKDGEAQIVERFADPDMWIRHDLWVETSFDSDGDGRMDRMHVDVTRPRQTETEALKLPVIYVTSPYFAGTTGAARVFLGPTPGIESGSSRTPSRSSGGAPRRTPDHFKEPCQDVGSERLHRSPFLLTRNRTLARLSTVGANESLAPKVVIQWLTGHAKGYTSMDGTETMEAFCAMAKWHDRVPPTMARFPGSCHHRGRGTGGHHSNCTSNTSYYHYYRSNGLIRHPGGYIGEDIDCLYDFIHSGNPIEPATA